MAAGRPAGGDLPGGGLRGRDRDKPTPPDAGRASALRTLNQRPDPGARKPAAGAVVPPLLPEHALEREGKRTFALRCARSHPESARAHAPRACAHARTEPGETGPNRSLAPFDGGLAAAEGGEGLSMSTGAGSAGEEAGGRLPAAVPRAGVLLLVPGRRRRQSGSAGPAAASPPSPRLFVTGLRHARAGGDAAGRNQPTIARADQACAPLSSRGSRNGSDSAAPL